MAKVGERTTCRCGAPVVCVEESTFEQYQPSVFKYEPLEPRCPRRGCDGVIRFTGEELTTYPPIPKYACTKCDVTAWLRYRHEPLSKLLSEA